MNRRGFLRSLFVAPIAAVAAPVIGKEIRSLMPLALLGSFWNSPSLVSRHYSPQYRKLLEHLVREDSLYFSGSRAGGKANRSSIHGGILS